MITKSNHTPIPWKIEKYGAPSQMGHRLAINGDERDVPVCDIVDRPSAAANAEIICLAVNTRDELIDALLLMLDAYAPGADSSALAAGEQSLHSAVRAARAALAKARGETTP